MIRSRVAFALLALLALFVAPGAAAAQGADIPSTPALRRALATIRADTAWTLDQQASICQVPAPPLKEAERAAEFARRLRALGVQQVRVDREGNVIGERPGTAAGPVVVLSAHLDTVFPDTTNVTVSRAADTLRGPGISDDCRGLAAVLTVARAFAAASVRTRGPIRFVGTVGEEGQGNLRGVRALFAPQRGDSVDYFISVDGSGLGLTSAGVGSHRYRITISGPGGHSYGAFGMPNPIHALGRAIARIADVQVPREPKTTFNVGVISGGTSVNSIAPTAIMEVDMRSESPAALDSLDRRVRAAVDSAVAAEQARWPASPVRLAVRVDTIGIRPAGAQPDTARIVRVARAAARTLGFDAPPGAASTDSNIPLSLGIPAVTLDAGGSGRGAHSGAERFVATDRAYLGPQWAALVAATLAGVE